MPRLLGPLVACLLLVACGEDAVDLGDVRGRVVGAGNEPVAGATARLTGTSVDAVTAADGTFEIDGVPRGNYTVTVEIASSGRLQFIESPLFEFAGAAVDLGTLRLQNAADGHELGEVTGRVLTVDGDPVVDADVELRGGEGLIGTTRSGSGGGFAFRGVGPGLYRVVATVQDNDDNVLRGIRDGLTITRDAAARVLQNATIVVAPEARLGLVTGTVTDHRDRPVAGAQVGLALLAAEDGPTIAQLSTATNAVGAFVFTDVPDTDGGAGLRIVAAGFAAATRTIAVNGGGTANEDFELDGTTRQTQRPPTGVDALAATYPVGGGPASRAVATARRRATGGRLARFAGARASRLAPAGHLIEVRVAFSPVVGADTAAQILYRSHAQDLGDNFLAVGRGDSAVATLLVDSAGALSVGSTWHYRVSTLGIHGNESELSDQVAVTPLPQIATTAPVDGDTGVPLTGFAFEWTAAAGAQGYQVLLFDEFPGTGAAPIFTSDQLAAQPTRLRYEGPSLTPTTPYYWYAVGFDRRDPRAAGAETYTPLVRFTTATE